MVRPPSVSELRRAIRRIPLSASCMIGHDWIQVFLLLTTSLGQKAFALSTCGGCPSPHRATKPFGLLYGPLRALGSSVADVLIANKLARQVPKRTDWPQANPALQNLVAWMTARSEEAPPRTPRATVNAQSRQIAGLLGATINSGCCRRCHIARLGDRLVARRSVDDRCAASRRIGGCCRSRSHIRGRGRLRYTSS
jgi:hypothetical protein